MAGREISKVGKYDVIARIAQGGMAEIFLARQKGIGGFSRRVVLKCILPALAEEPRFVAMFMEEARLASQIHHPNVVQIFDVGEDDDTYYIAMEFIDGLSVNSMTSTPSGDLRRLPIAVAGEIVAQACAGLHAAHKLASEDGTPFGLVHRDVSPQNLMVSRDGGVKLVDFGIAKAQDSSVTTRTGSIKGKYAYMSPEQVRGRPLDRRSDVFSLGTVFYELLTGIRLFQRNAELAILVAIIEDPIPAPHEVDAAIPKALSDVILKSLEREREARYATAAEMGQAVREVLGACGHYTSPETLAKYLEEECSEQVAARKSMQPGLGTPLTGNSLEARLAELPRQTEEPPAPAATVALAKDAKPAPEIIDLPPPRSRSVEDADRARLEAKRAGGSASWVDEPTTKLTPAKIDREGYVEKMRSGPLPEPQFAGDEDEDDDGEIGEAPTKAAAPIPPERSPDEPGAGASSPGDDDEEEDAPTATAPFSPDRPPETPAPLSVAAPQLDDLGDDDELDDEETVERSVEPEGAAAAQAKASRASSPGGGWVEVATSSALADLEALALKADQDAAASAKHAAAPAEDAAEEDEPAAPPATSPAPAAAKRVISWPKPKPAAPPPRRWKLWAGIAAAVVLLGGAGALYALSIGDARPSGVPLIYAHPPSYPEAVIEAEFRPLAAYLERRVDRPIDVVTTRDYETLEDQLVDGEIDIANLPPLLFVLTQQRDRGVTALAMHAFEDVSTDQSYILARSDSDIGSIDQLKGQRFCYPDRRSTTGYLLPRRFLRSKGLDPDGIFSEVVFSKGHVGVMEDIASGRCDAGAVISSAWANARQLGIKSQRLKLVTPAGESMRDVVCASPALPRPLAEALRAALLDFRASRDIGREALGAVFAIDHFVDASATDLADIEAAARAEGLIQ